MVRSNSKFSTSLVFLGILLGGLLVFSGGGFLAITIPTEVLIPQFGNLECRSCNNPIATNIIADDEFITRTPTLITCGGTGLQGNFPAGCTVQVERLATAGATSAIEYKVCSTSNLGDCKETAPFLSIGNPGDFTRAPQPLQSLEMKEGDTFAIRSRAKVQGSIYSPLLKADPFCLFDTSAQGFLSKASTCDITSLNYRSESEKTRILAEEGTVLVTGQVINYIGTFTSEVNNLDLIILDGEAVYVYQPGAYYRIRQASEGQFYADVSKSVTDSRLKCRPSLSQFCQVTTSGTATVSSTDGGTGLELPVVTSTEITGEVQEGISCGPLGPGEIDQFIPVSSTEQCKLSCVNGQITQTECKEIPVCEDDTFLFDSRTGECIQPDIKPPVQPAEKEQAVRQLLILFGILAVIVGVALVSQRKKLKPVGSLVMGFGLGMIILELLRVVI